MKKFLATALVLAASSAAFAGTFTFSAVPVAGAPAGQAAFDILFDLSPTSDDWTAAGIKATTAGGATWVYQTNLDPNAPLPTAPGTSNKFCTFVNNPRAATANARFTTATSFAGSYSPPSPSVMTGATEFNVAWLESPPVSTSLDAAAAITRLEITDPTGGGVVVNGTGPVLANVELACGSSENGGNLQLFRFTLNSVPEPASLALLALGGLLGLRRR